MRPSFSSVIVPPWSGPRTISTVRGSASGPSLAATSSVVNTPDRAVKLSAVPTGAAAPGTSNGMPVKKLICHDNQLPTSPVLTSLTCKFQLPSGLSPQYRGVTNFQLVYGSAELCRLANSGGSARSRPAGCGSASLRDRRANGCSVSSVTSTHSTGGSALPGKTRSGPVQSSQRWTTHCRQVWPGNTRINLPGRLARVVGNSPADRTRRIERLPRHLEIARGEVKLRADALPIVGLLDRRQGVDGAKAVLVVDVGAGRVDPGQVRTDRVLSKVARVQPFTPPVRYALRARMC